MSIFTYIIYGKDCKYIPNRSYEKVQILFIYSKLKDFVVEVKNYKLNNLYNN